MIKTILQTGIYLLSLFAKMASKKTYILPSLGRGLGVGLLLLTALDGNAQISIGGNVYGGGNEGDMGGRTTVSIYAGDIHEVYGGARQANVGGSTFVHIDCANALANSYIVIDKVYGGNDIAGTIGTSAEIPAELTQATENKVDNTWNAFVRLSTKMTTNAQNETVPDETQKTYIGQLFGGGDGEYDYTSDESPYKGMTKPELGKTYLEILGGSIVYAYGGGNNATITESTVICVDNPSKVVNTIEDKDGNEVLTTDRFRYKMGINTGFSFPSSDAFQIGRLFGGNNKAEMAIRPLWFLKSGKVRNLYSGGNKGMMTNPEGLMVDIQEDSKIVIDNVYGGCRMADVRPMRNGADVLSNDIQVHDADGNRLYSFPAGLSARVIVIGGDVNNVYGGNDITGRVYGGCAVGIRASVRGDVYGGGNGSYPYTDNPDLIGDDIYGDLYYEVPAGKTTIEALNDFRPNAEQVSIRLVGDDADHRTIIGGSVYCGGNSATLKTVKQKARLELKIGSHVIADKVFLGNNGENMIKYNVGDGALEGVLHTYQRTDLTSDGSKFSSMDLTDKDQFAAYMNGVSLDLIPSVVFDNIENEDPENYEDYSTYFGSFFCGGNVGSMTGAGKTSINFQHKIIVYNKVVGGCNNAFVTPTTYNALFEGGITGVPDNDGNKLELNFSGLKIQPKRWMIERDGAYEPVLDTDGNVKYILDEKGNRQLEWNTISATNSKDVAPVTSGASEASPVTSTDADLDRRLKDGSIYGGCYNSGIVNGNVVININSSIIDRDIVFDKVEEDATGEDKLYDNDEYHITERRSGVILAEQGMDVLGVALNVFGGGKGVDTEIWGSATVNLNRGYVFQIFGGSEEGAIGKGVYNTSTDKLEYSYDENYSTYINLNGPIAGVSKHDDMSENMAECEFIYGGSFFGPIAGNCIINLDNGRIFNSFAGSCNADILGHTETYVGVNGFPFVRDFIYGGNDLGGRILGTKNFDSRLRNDAVRAKVSNADMLNASAYIEYVQGRVEKIFGGAYGVYNYKDDKFRKYFDADGHAKESEGYYKPYLDNAFINFKPIDTNNPLNTVEQIYGAGQGFLGEEEEDKMQDRSYILIDVPQTMTTYQGTEIFGAGECGGVGMGVAKATADASATAHKASAIIDLLSGHFKAVYGGSYMEGVTRRTEINVPVGSTFRAEAIFGGAYGVYNEYPCDVYEANVNWNSADALVGGYRTGIYGGNNNYRRTLYGKVNINAPVYYDKEHEYFATVYGAGYGKDTWSQYTEVNLNDGARVYEVYGGGQLGRVLSKKSADAWKAATDTQEKVIDLSLGTGYEDNGLVNDLATYKYNTNVRINEGADVCGYMYNGSRSGAYAYGGGLGNANIANTGDVHGTTFIGLFGGKVTKDLYAAGTVGSVNNKYKVDTDDFGNPFIASANAYIEGGTARNVYGGGWQGSVGYHEGAISEPTTNDVLGETHVIIGKYDGTSFIDGLPAIERNAYGGGEGGAVFGTTNITLNNGYIGYRHFDAVPTTETDLDYIKVSDDNYYQEKLNDETWSGDGTNRLYDSGCIFGGGYIDNSSVDVTNVKMYGGTVRNSVFGGGEIAAIGRGIIHASGQDNSVRTLQGIYKAGKTNVELYEGDVHRNVFGGGRGYNNLGDGGTLYSDGYVFGQTEVHVHGGTVGTTKELARENGNVFGGGDIGYVYSAYEKDGELFVGIKDGNRYDDKWEGYYYAYDIDEGLSPDNYKPYIPAEFVYDESDPNWVMDGGEYVLTEDCKVLIEPNCKVLSPVTINGHSYAVGQYVPIADLNTLKDKNGDAAIWNCLDPTGIVIFNAVFAGGNTSSGSSAVYANTTTVFGNATASVDDVYHRDLITLGTGHTGGLYGDGNLTFVDGYRGLNVTNYGTDYYTISPEISYTEYLTLPAREAAYYQLKYKCIKECTDKDGTTYHTEAGSSKASTLTYDDLLTLFENIYDGDVPILVLNDKGETVPNPTYWEQNGVCSIYAGRLMNSIQRADFCGVFGSRMVMQGAQDRVPEVVDHTNYTINRVREVSLNQQHSKIESDLTLLPGKQKAANPEDQNPDDYADLNKAIHGNYFGIYSIVNYLGALTSDVHFMKDYDVRRTDNSDESTYKCATNAYQNGSEAVASEAYGTASYYDWKASFHNERKRNNGTSLNKVSLASGVYLELYTEKVQGTDLDLHQKDWGYITGVIELDLINVQPGIGGGFVYAKNEHRKGTYQKRHHTTLTLLNADAITRKDFTYDGEEVEWETSGNFVHGTQTIIDDCYNVTGKYSGPDAVPAHYWFIKGSVYVYDQYISAYTGAPTSYTESVEIPLTITAASHGTMKLLNVQPNKYAYYSAPNTPLEAGKKMVINDVDYYLNDPITYWDWYLLSKSEQNLFVDETYVTIADCKYNSTDDDADIIPEGTVMLPDDYNSLKAAHPKVYHVALQKEVDFDYIFRSSNNMGHDTGYMLTYKVNNPTDWDTWYTKFDSSTHEKKQKDDDGYNNGPTYRLNGNTGGVFGQRNYEVSNLIPKDVYDTYTTMAANHASEIPGGQASFEGAYIVTQEYVSGNKALHVGSTVSATEAATMMGYVAPAYICTSTIPLSKTEYIYVSTRMTEAEKTAYYNRFKDGTDAEKLIAEEINDNIVPAYYCTAEGLYGGDFYEANKNYRGLGVWSSMSESDRSHFVFNYDALDLLIDPLYSKNDAGKYIYAEGQKYQYDSALGTLEAAEANLAGYSLTKPVNYTATYTGDDTGTYNGITLEKNKEYKRVEYEKLPNEKRHYSSIKVTEAGTVYVVNTTFQIGNSPYAAGTTISQNIYNSLGETEQEKVTALTFTAAQTGEYYFCRESYTIGEKGEGVAVTGLSGIGAAASGTYNDGSNVPVGLVITDSNYGNLKNHQLDFTIHGIAPTETSTLYVSRESDIFNLSKEKIITVIYQYDYEESDVAGLHVTPVSERHVVNIHVQFKSGIPTVEDIKAPQIVLPGTFVGIREPHVTPGAYEVTGGGWKLFENIGDAENHTNGIEYTPTADPLYWYQDGYYVAYYAKTYLGETYSNYVQVSVANYHDLKKVMEDKEHHYYVDNENVKRDSKIYITDGTNGANQLKQLFDLSVFSGSPADVTDGIINTGPLAGHALLDDHIKGAQNLEFFLRTNVTVPSGSPAWTPIGDATNCFAGTLHGDGYHIDGLDNSLFGYLCGNVYNLGVTGSFTSAGVADTGSGYVENCWINTTATSGFATDVRAVFGKPTATDLYKIVNCYYPETKAYCTEDNGRGLARPMPEASFLNGTVGYDLNGFYLFKRYNDHQNTNGKYYYYYTANDDGTLSAPLTEYYNEASEYCSSGVDGAYLTAGYVEDRYADGDYRYANGVIPESADPRMHIGTDEKEYFYPIWPDDYIYFGQMLTYEWNDQRPHEKVPSRIVKMSGRLSNTDESNRIYRAPAYYQSKVMNVAHFNPSVNLVAYSKPKSANDKDLYPAYPNMTAIDFAGHNDNTWTVGRVSSGSPATVDLFYLPLLDESGLNSITNRDESPNLLVYAPAETSESGYANKKTYDVLTAYFTDPSYDDCYDSSDPYRRVESAPYWTVFGHLVHSDLKATSDHLLLDKKTFNCPISYSFVNGKRMWYQRTPDLFVSLNKGWETVSLPFTAELVSTQNKGEITHFYSGSRTMEGSNAKIGHEYWLREYKGVSNSEPSGSPAGVVTATFNYPAASGATKHVDNTFLWDYYYSKNAQKDANTDTYQTYYETSRELQQYPLFATATPYIIGFPSKTYYEFDLSGEWTAQNTATTTPAQLDKQVISFISEPNITIAVSDDELTASAVDGYTFLPNYMSKVVNGYIMNDDGTSFDITPTGGSAPTPFRPYFIAGSANAKPKQNAARSIIFTNNETSFSFGNDKDPSEGEIGDESILISVRRHKIIVTSSLQHEAEVRIVNTAGLNVSVFTIKPGETIETNVNHSGVYIVQADGGKYQKKVAMK